MLEKEKHMGHVVKTFHLSVTFTHVTPPSSTRDVIS